MQDKPLFLEIKEQLEQQTRSGALAANDKLPSERKMSELFSTTRVTLREALSRMEADGLIYREDRRGWFVSPERLRFDPTVHTNFHHMVKAHGRQPKTELLSASELPAEPWLQKKLQLQPLQAVYKLERLRSADGRALCYAENYLLPKRVPELLKHDLDGSLTELLAQHYQLHYGKIAVELYPTSLPAKAARAMGVTAGSPALLLQRIDYDRDGNMVDLDQEYWRHDAIAICASAEP